MTDATEPNAGVLELWRDLLEKDDRTSPAEYPDMALITQDEFVYCCEQAAQRERERCIGWVRRYPTLGMLAIQRIEHGELPPEPLEGKP